MYVIRTLIRYPSRSAGKRINKAKKEEDRRIGDDYNECICRPIALCGCLCGKKCVAPKYRVNMSHITCWRTTVGKGRLRIAEGSAVGEVFRYFT